MLCQHPRLPLWRVFGASLGLLAILLHVLFAVVMMRPAEADSAFDLSVICLHDGASAPATDGEDTGKGGTGSRHSCTACACPHHGVTAAAPTGVGLALPAPRSQPLPAAALEVAADGNRTSPYASRAPPRSA
jgi:DUF2946 family protein